MKKKLIASLIAGAVLSTGIIGLTACGGGHSINKGEEVDEAGWKAAYTATMEAKNFTMENYSEITLKVKGSNDFLKEEVGVDSIDMSVKTKADGKSAYDLENSTYYTKGTSKIEVSGVPDELKEEYSNKEYVVENYSVKDGQTVYTAFFSGAATEPKWEVSTYSMVYSPLAGLLNQSFATEKNGTTANISTLYSAFTYKSGVYSATLYQSETEYKVSVSIKGGYVVGLSVEYTEADEEEGYSESESYKMVYNLSNYGSTTVTPSDDAKKAVDDYKAA